MTSYACMLCNSVTNDPIMKDGGTWECPACGTWNFSDSEVPEPQVAGVMTAQNLLHVIGGLTAALSSLAFDCEKAGLIDTARRARDAHAQVEAAGIPTHAPSLATEAAGGAAG